MNPFPKKRYAQYWLRDQGVLRQIVESAEIQPDETVLEIGPGTGNLTELLLQAAKGVAAIELDQTLAPILAKRFAHQPLQVHFGDVLTEPLPAHCPVVVANIPYYITGLILEKLLGSPAQPNHQFRRVVLLVQKEIGERLVAPPSTPGYNGLSVAMQYLARVELVAVVPARAFQPQPKVDSAIISLTPHQFSPAATDPQLFHRLLKQGFGQRRKMLKNNLKPWRDPAAVARLLTDLQERPDSRAEMLSVAQWVRFANQWVSVP
ncbi:16S rRNA (adenine(1518)-N(6)/adenine(1519)-N(6))-dimethyltransferase RsmA [Candidatus Cyanaurora vandensis]|uniref:16S rRNA (adenine(1518)-N(6)/adenine(1519)-N(6))- dimethyltransferase RsmA n=1 Tax=Candidatus Cyanaurora vandensis TaxID=2714958 RepID=UPI00257FFB74|nr:16S rRNA (adenine(1518)-N(6)/adenine(1519)-N(6))-dimethyltransferase RsmA [Candidatus Cyanaurora vandensis]